LSKRWGPPYFPNAAIAVAASYPEKLFAHLDAEWQAFEESAENSGVGIIVPPVLGIVLSQCANRAAIPKVILDLRNDWASARRKVWALIRAEKEARTLQDAVNIRREIQEASQLFSPTNTSADSSPSRVFWAIVAMGAAGATTALISGGKPVIGGFIGSVTQAGKGVPGPLREFGPALFRRGAFDLARRIRRGASEIELRALSRLLSESEKVALGL
jgi:hypothetical protein